MKLRSIKLTNFRDVDSLVVSDLSAVDAECGAHADVLGVALRFAFTGRVPERMAVIARNARFACVDVRFGLPGDGRVSVFRGLDRRGGVHASLREAGGQRITRGVDEVQARLRELLGGDPAAGLATAWPDQPAAAADPRYVELMDLGGRLQRERLDVADELEGLAVEDLGEPPPPPPRGDEEGLAVPWAVATLASTLLAALAFESVGPRSGASPVGELVLGIGALTAVAGSFAVTSRRLLRGRAAGRDTALRRAPDRHAPLAHLHDRLEALDETIALFTMEAGRASRALRLPMPPRRVADVGLRPDESHEGLRERIREIAERLDASRPSG